MQYNYFSSGFNKWPNTSSWGSVRIFLGGYLYAVTQHLLTRRNSLKGFPRSLGQRPHFIGFFDFIESFDSLLVLSFLSHRHQPSFESFVMLVHEAQAMILTKAARGIKAFDYNDVYLVKNCPSNEYLSSKRDLLVWKMIWVPEGAYVQTTVY